MSDYTGKICPYCKSELKPEDDIVVCSICEMPHHKDCWIENQGCTTFGCTGTIKGVSGGENSVTAGQMNFDEPAAVFCTQCGTKNVGASFCVHCGAKLVAPAAQTQAAPVLQPEIVQPQYAQPAQPQYTPPAQPQYTPPAQPQYTQPAQPQYTPPAQPQYTPPAQPQYTQPQYTPPVQQYNPPQPQGYQAGGYNPYQAQQNVAIDPVVQQLVGTKTEYYFPKFQELKRMNKKTSWNWPAFLVTPYWLLYRKMYGYGAAVLALDVVISLLSSGFLSLLIFAGYIVFGVFANWVYMQHLEGKAGEAKTMMEPQKSQFIAANSGVNTLVMVLCLIGRILLFSLL